MNEAVKRFPSAKALVYIHDPNFRIRGFYVQTDSDTEFFDVHTQTVIPIEQLYKQIDARRIEPGFSASEKALVPIIQVGAADAKGDSWNRSFVVLICAILAVILGTLAFFLLKTKKARRMHNR